MKINNFLAVNSTFSTIFITALAPILWGTTYIVTTEFLPLDKPLLAATIRTLPIGVLITLWARKLPIYNQYSNFDKGLFIKILILSFLNITCFQALLFIAAYRLSGGIASVISSIQPLIIIGLIAISTKKSPKTSTLWAIIISMVGMALLLIRGYLALDAIGVISALFGAISMAIGIYLTKKWKPNVSNLTFTGWQLMLGGLMLLPCTLIFETLPNNFNPASILGYSYLAIFGSLIAYSLWFRGIDKLNPVSISILGAFSPITATLIGWLCLGQSLTAMQVIGFFMIMIAVITVQLSSIEMSKNLKQCFIHTNGD